ncbi:glycosyltransferase family A protein [Oryzihumus leptocrescens]|uniref:Glycosyl transferase family 2 n=1 Tax=Oryzihumus leptocrescens TaxID=297536 RepID=A0A542ZI22_9MICO|nr:glycosyltransferase family A protein [Oryzihumus leptocrescens]TQL59984.1 glycosyl transferase family 2 [Oryzihumus leptocrescens]
MEHQVDTSLVEDRVRALRTSAEDVVVSDLHEQPAPQARIEAAVRSASGGRVIVAVPNVARPALVGRLLLGMGDAELPAPAAGGWFTRERLDRLFAAEGYQPLPQQQAATLPAVTGNTLEDLLRATAARAGATDDAWLVRAYEAPDPKDLLAREPFLSVLVRTQGRRTEAFRDALLCLSAQTCDDFEVLVLGHDLTPEDTATVQGVIAEQADFLRSRTRYVPVSGGGRTAPLNAGAAAARGRYIGFLDDDDLVMAHWVEVFRDAAKGCDERRIVRALAVEQSVETFEDGGFRSTSWPSRRWDVEMDLLSHLVDNHSPLNSYAYPRAAFSEFGFRFDPDLPVLEDWDLLVRSASLLGVADTPEVSSIYRRWPAHTNSFSELAQEKWLDLGWQVASGWDSQPLLLPAGTASRLRREGMIVLKFRPLKDRVRDKVQRTADAWAPRLSSTPLYRPLRAFYRRIRAVSSSRAIDNG